MAAKKTTKKTTRKPRKKKEKTTLQKLEWAATLMMEVLIPMHSDLAKEMADLQYKCPRFHIVAGSLGRLIEEGRLADALESVEEHWISETLEREPSECGFCGKIFDPERLAQKFCSEKCGQSFNALPRLIVEEKEKEDVRRSANVTDTTGPSEPDPIVDDTPEPTSTEDLQEALKKSADIAYEEITA